ncbi:MAG: hypothetical protein KKD44_16165 [Proteobacteria bacterium]|nr:hypothetical protein [Pseudomonadota bacterium]
MNSLIRITCLLALLVMFVPFSAQCEEEGDNQETPIAYTQTSLQSSGRNSVGIVVGAVTVDGKNYQQVGIRADIPLGKLGLGLDAQLLLDEEGSVREEDWNDTEDFFNILYYLRWDQKGAPFYAKIGSLDYTYIGYANIINGYSNAIEYPEYKRIGMEMSFITEKLTGELLLNDYKELADDRPSMVVGTRLGYRVLPKLVVGASIVSDLNEYNGLRDTDDDGYPDEMDAYPYDGALVTELDRLNAIGLEDTTIADLIAHGEVDSTVREDLINYSKKRSDLTIWGLDVGIPIIEGEFIKMDLYSAYSDIVDYGWGITAPGFRTLFGNFLTLTAEYRFQSKEFLYGYFNNTYELERAQVVDDGLTKRVVTKQETLRDITEDMDGFLAGVSVNVFNYIRASGQFQDMKGGDIERKSLAGEVVLNDKAISFLPTVKGYYAQNNVESLQEWKTPSTVAGIIVQLNLGSATLAFNNQYTFVDVNGDGEIKGSEETVKTLSVSSTVTF